MPSNESQLLTAVGSLTQAIQQLNQSIGSNGNTSAYPNASGPPTPQETMAGTSSTGALANWTGGALSNWNAANPEAAAAANANIAASNATAQAALKAASNDVESASVPPGVTVATSGGGVTTSGSGSSSNAPTRTNSPDESSLEALTWQELGGLGGSLGRFRTRSYTNQQYVGTLGNIAQWGSQFGSQNQVLDSNGNVVNAPASGWNKGLSSVSNWLGSTTKNSAAMAGLTGITSSYLLGSGWSAEGRDLGYGTNNPGFLGYNDPLGNLSATDQGSSLALERTTLEGRNPFDSFGSGLTSSMANQAVNTLAGMGFSNQNGIQGGQPSGDNTTIAENLMAPLMRQGVSAEGAAQWTEALRNSGTSISQLTSSLQGLSQSAQASKLTVDQYNTSLVEFANSQVAEGGTASQGAATGMAWTAATGMAPTVFQQLQSNQMYQAMMMAQNGVLPSGIGNLTPGAQMQGAQSMVQMLNRAFAGLNRNQYETVDGHRLITAYGQQMVNAQIAQETGLTQTQVARYLNQSSQENKIAGLDDIIGSAGSGTPGGPQGTGLWSVLQQGGSGYWSNLSPSSQREATSIWDKSIRPNLASYGLHASQIRALDKNPNIRADVRTLQTDLTANQKSSSTNQVKAQIQVQFVGQAANIFKQKGKSYINLAANSAAGGLPNNITNTPYGDAIAATKADPSPANMNNAAGYPIYPGG